MVQWLDLVNKFSAFLSAFVIVELCSVVHTVFAQSNWDATLKASTEAFTIIDDSDTLSDIYLQFGESVAETLTFHRTNDWFEFSNDVYIQGELTTSGVTILPLPDCANLVTNGSGSIICGNTTQITFTGSDLAAVQVRRDTNLNLALASTWLDITFNNTDIESNVAALEHNDVNTEIIDIKQDGYYMISYHVTSSGGSTTGVQQHDLSVRVLKNNADVLEGSLTRSAEFVLEYIPNTISILAFLQKDDEIKLQALRELNSPNEIIDETVFTIVSLESGGSSGSLLQVDADDLYVNTTGDTMTGTLNIANGGELNVEGSITTDSNLGLNSDGAAVDVGIRFGGPATQSLVYAIGNTRFEFSDDVYVNGNAAVTENLFINVDDTAADASISFGGTTPQSLLYSDGNTRFELSDDTQIDGELGVTENINSRCGAHDSFSFERGGVSSNNSWAVGNGQTPWGAPMACSGEVTAMSAVCTGSIGTSLTAVLRKNNVPTTCVVNIAATVGDATSVDCNETFAVDDVLGIYAGTETGAWTECVGTFWTRYDIQ